MHPDPLTPEAGPPVLQLEGQKEMEKLSEELSKLMAANKQFEKSHKDLEAAQKALETRASGSESALKQAQAKLRSAEDAAAAGQKLLESVRCCLCLRSSHDAMPHLRIDRLTFSRPAMHSYHRV